jgi:hypothetical protein
MPSSCRETDDFFSSEIRGVGDAGLNPFLSQPWVAAENFVRWNAGRQIVEHD